MKQETETKIIHKLSFDRKNRHVIFSKMTEEKQAQILLHLSKHIRHDIVSSLPDEKLIAILNHLDPDEANDIIRLFPDHHRKRIIEKFGTELRNTLEILNQFDPQTAAGLMNLDYIQVNFSDSIAEVAKQFKIHEKRTGRLPAIIIMENGKIKGYLPGHTLGFALPKDKAKKHLHKISTIKHNATHNEVVHLFRSHPHNKIAVLGNHGSVVGIIYSDDILRALREQESASLYNFAGLHDEENVLDSATQKIIHRYKWLILNLATAFLAAFTVSMFEDVISKYVLLAVYMPIVAGMGGNAGTQTLAVLVRGIALKQIELTTVWPTLKREILSSLANGAINGILVASIVLIVNKDAKIAFILGIAMIVNLFIASFFGTLIPLLMKKLGKDPATSATIFITTATDVLGFMAFLGLATIVLE